MPKTKQIPLKIRLDVQERAMRVLLTELVDEAYVAYRQSGHDLGEYAKTQWFQSILFTSINVTPAGTYQRIGALQLAITFMQRLIEHYQTDGQNLAEGRFNELRGT